MPIIDPSQLVPHPRPANLPQKLLVQLTHLSPYSLLPYPRLCPLLHHLLQTSLDLYLGLPFAPSISIITARLLLARRPILPITSTKNLRLGAHASALFLAIPPGTRYSGYTPERQNVLKGRTLRDEHLRREIFLDQLCVVWTTSILLKSPTHALSQKRGTGLPGSTTALEHLSVTPFPPPPLLLGHPYIHTWSTLASHISLSLFFLLLTAVGGLSHST